MPEVSRALAMKNFGVGIWRSPESCKDTIMMRPSALPRVLHSDKTGNTVGTLYPKNWEVGVMSKEATEKTQMEEFGTFLLSCSPYPLRILRGSKKSYSSSPGQTTESFGSHVCRQRLHRKYLFNMPMLENDWGPLGKGRFVLNYSSQKEPRWISVCLFRIYLGFQRIWRNFLRAY